MKEQEKISCVEAFSFFVKILRYPSASQLYEWLPKAGEISGLCSSTSSHDKTDCMRKGACEIQKVWILELRSILFLKPDPSQCRSICWAQQRWNVAAGMAVSVPLMCMHVLPKGCSLKYASFSSPTPLLQRHSYSSSIPFTNMWWIQIQIRLLFLRSDIPGIKSPGSK